MKTQTKTTTQTELQAMCVEMLQASLESKVNVSVEFIAYQSGKRTICSVTFYKDEDDFTMDLYLFYSKKRNEKVVYFAKKLMESGEYEAINKEYFTFNYKNV